jgi:hypothetical protein
MIQTVAIALDPNQYRVNYFLNGHKSPAYHVVPGTGGNSPFNTPETPFLLPSALDTLEVNVTAALGPAGAPVYWGVRIQFFTQNNNLIHLHGFSGQYDLDHLDAMVTGPVQSNGRATAGFTPIDGVGPFRDALWQPTDLREGTPVRMSFTVLAFSDSQHKIPVVDSDPANNTLDLWLMRV